MEIDIMDKCKKLARGERKRKKLLAEYELARSNDAAKRPGQFLDSKDEKKARVELSDPQRLSDSDFKKLKKQLAERKKFFQSLPRFFLQYAGNVAALSIAQDDRSPILMSDLQQLLSYALYGNSLASPPNRWCQLQKPNKLTNIVTLVVEGITTVDFFDYEHLFPNLTTHFEDRVEVLAPVCYGSNVVQEFVRVCPLIGSEESILEKARSFENLEDPQERLKAFRKLFPFNSKETNPSTKTTPSSSNLPTTDTFPRTFLLLSMYQMLVESYPLPVQSQFGYNNHDTTGFVNTKLEYTEVSDWSPMYSIDCEMCFTDAGKHELTRIAVVDEKLEVVYESLVKPRNKIVNYLTRYSGITKEMLEDVTTTLEDVQKAIQNIIPNDAILVGHSLNGDLKALNFYHPYVIDTSVVFNLSGARRMKPGLASLADRFLEQKIQQSHHGHSPVEDAQAAMKLLLLKLSKGHQFGDFLEDPQSTTDIQCPTLTVFHNNEKAKKTVAVIGSEHTLACYANICGESSHYKQIPASNNKHTIDRLLESAVLHDFSVAHIDLSKKLRKCKSPVKREKIFKRLDNWIDSIFSHISLNGMCSIVFGGPKDISDHVKIEKLESSSDATSSCNVRNNGRTKDSNVNNVNGNGKVKIKEETTTDTDNSTDDSDNNNNDGSNINSIETTIKSEPQEDQSNQCLVRRRNGAVFIRVKSAK